MTKISSCALLVLATLGGSVAMADDGIFSGVSNNWQNLIMLAPATSSDPTQTTSASILSTTLNLSDHKSLLIGVSLESGLITGTSKSLPVACAGVEVTVNVDGVPIDPQNVRFNTRCQSHVSTPNALQTALSSCADGSNGGVVDGIIDPGVECTGFNSGTYELLMDTTSANHFNFIALNLSEGQHTVSVDATLFANGGPKTAKQTLANSVAVINVGTLSVQQVSSQQSDDNTLDD